MGEIPEAKAEESVLKKDKRKSVQTSIYQFLLQGLQYPSIEEVLARRFRRWFAADEACHAAKKASINMRLLHKIVPACVQFAVLNTLLNGWATAARFQLQGKCRLAHSCLGEDRLEHYACCPHQLYILNESYVVPAFGTLKQFLGLETVDMEEAALLAMHCYAVRTLVNSQRAVGARLQDGAARRSLQIGHQRAMMHSKHLSAIASKRRRANFW